MSDEPHYGLVGANWKGDDQAAAFYRRGYWELSWTDERQPGMAQQRDSIRSGDRIAVKSMLGQESPIIAIRYPWLGRGQGSWRGQTSLHQLARHRPESRCAQPRML